MGILQGASGILMSNNKILHNEWSLGDNLITDGANDTIKLSNSLGNSDLLNFSKTDNFSISIWVQPVSYGGGYNLTLPFRRSTEPTLGSNGYDVYFRNTNSGLSKRGNNGINRMAKQWNHSAIGTGWVHFVFVFTDFANSELYVNGETVTYDPGNSVDSLSASIYDMTNSGDAIIHSDFGVGFGKANYSQVIVFNKAITQTEDRILYEKKGQIIPNSAAGNIVAKYDFENKQGTVLTDRSGNGLNGTLINMPDNTFGLTNCWRDKYGNPITQA